MRSRKLVASPNFVTMVIALGIYELTAGIRKTKEEAAGWASGQHLQPLGDANFTFDPSLTSGLQNAVADLEGERFTTENVQSIEAAKPTSGDEIMTPIVINGESHFVLYQVNSLLVKGPSEATRTPQRLATGNVHGSTSDQGRAVTTPQGNRR